MKMRVGLGVDIHKFVDGRPLILGGVTIPFDRGLIGHSDADALLHAVIDALLGAAGKGDIGSLFPDTERDWKDARSLDLLAIAWDKVKADGWRVQNLDCSIILERPKIAPYVLEMKQNIAKVLEIDQGDCAIKATTSEGLGFIGRGEGIFAQAVILLEK